jgi:hypothetical protein
MKKLYDENNCPWKDKGFCSFLKAAQKQKKKIGDFQCDADCDYSTLKFDKDEILVRIRKEKLNIKMLYLTARERKKMVMLDKVKAIYDMSRALRDHFGIVNEYIKLEETYMVDSDRIKSTIRDILR